MTLPQRDRQIVHNVWRFQQLTAAQIGELVFGDVGSRTPCARALKRLVETRYLARIERQRLVGGSKGGGGQYVYQLGRRGYQLYFDGEYRPARNVNYHQILLADSFLRVWDMQKAQVLTIDAAETREDATAEIAGTVLRPDMRLDVTRHDGAKIPMWLEVDMATEGKKQIRDKLARYWQAAVAADDAEWPTIPLVVWVACDEERAKELTWIISQGKDKAAQAMFRVTTEPHLPSLLMSAGVDN